MSKNETSLYLIRCITNLHAGSGDENFGVVDKQVQRDATSGFPTIFSSSLKGAFRERFDAMRDYKAARAATSAVHQDIVKIFGSATDEVKNLQQGALIFLPARLLSMPLRSNDRPYFNATCPALINDFLEFQDIVGISLPARHRDVLGRFAAEATPMIPGTMPATKKIYIEETEMERGKVSFSAEEQDILSGYLGNYPALLPDGTFSGYAAELPVIARNNLDNGRSVNLWYEEVVPRESRFWFGNIAPENEANAKTVFENIILQQPIQIGANATIGYGMTRISKIQIQ